MGLQQIELQPASQQVPRNLEKVKITQDGSAVTPSSPLPPPLVESGYLSLLEKLHSTWRDCPSITITYRDLAYIVQIPVVEQNIRNFLLQGVDKIRRLNPFSRRKMMDFVALAPTSGMIRAGTNTLILAPPGHGKSTFLKALAGRLTNDKHLRGEIRYDGLTYKDALEKNIQIKRLTTYVGQQDMHFPVLTVKETMNFVVDSSIADASLLGDDELTTLSKRRADLMIQLLGLDECQDTIIGNDLLRGISGGQRRRVTLGEMLVTNARVMLLDEVSTGLDSAVTYHIFNALKSWTRITHGSIVTALLQPTPETYELFDDIILMREGVIVYHGPRIQVKEWFQTSVGICIPANVDEAGWIVDYLTDPSMLLKQMARDAKIQAKRASLTNHEIPATIPPAIVPVTSSEHEESTNEVIFHDFDENSAPQTPRTYTSIHEEKIHPNIQPIPTHQPPREDVAVTTDELLTRYQSSTQYADVTYTREQHQQQMSSDTAYQLDRTHWSPYTISQYGQSLPHSYFHHLKLCMGRQRMLTARNTQVIRPRVFQSIFLGFVYGTLFIQLPIEDYSSKFGLILILIMTGAFANLSELPTAAEARNVVTKQIDAGFVPPVAYVTSVQIWAVPLNLVEVAVYGSMMYWIPGFAPDAGRYFFWLLIMFSSSISLSTFFRTISYVASNPDVARQMDLPFIIIFVIFGGFLIPYGKVPRWLIWLFWSSPLSWAFRSLAQNEFMDSRYDTILPSGERTGDAHLNAFDIDTNHAYKWAGVGYLWGFAILFIFISSYALATWRGVVGLGTKRTQSSDKKSKLNKLASEDTFRIQIAPQVDKGVINAFGSGQAAIGAVGNTDRDRINNNPQNDVQQIIKTGEERQQENMGKDFLGEQLNASMIPSGSFQLAGLPFTPAVLSWRNLKYTVRIGKGKDAHDRVLLQSISGFAAPFTLTALMGASGSGKTTLMDVIAGRKTTGFVEGDIFVNGKPKETHSFNHLTGYVEQQDLHMGLHTVREALLFSAKLRLPTSVTDQDRYDWVEQVMMLVGLTKLADRLIGDASTPSLSPGQLKLVTIGVEMVANPTILFLDEPTSGLDAPSAFRVMKAVRRISQTGRSVVCTIHQPSAELFYMFNRLLLLRAGGECVYFGDIGEQGEQLVSYFNEAAGPKHPLPPLKQGQNPANWMLDVVGAGSNNPEGGPGSSDSSFPPLDYVSLWKQSALYKQAQVDTEQAYQSRPLDISDAKYVNRWTRYWEVQKRYFVMHWRNGPTNLTRCILQLIMGIFCGLIYLQLGRDDFQGLNSFLSVIFLGIAFPASISAASSFPSFFRQRAVYYRESTVGMYGFLSYSTALAIVEIPFIFFSLIWFMVPFYFMIGFESDVNLFFKFYLVVFVQALVYSFLSQLWMAMLPSSIAANILNGLFMSLFFMFGGLFIKASKIPAGWKWFYYIDPIPKTFIAATLPQLYCEGPLCPSVEVPGQGRIPIYEYVSNQIEGTESEYWPMIGWLILTMGVIRILNLLFLRFVSHIKR